MRRFLKVVVLLLVVTAVTTILLTPNPTDDVLGVMHRHRPPVALAVTLGVLQVAYRLKPNHHAQAVSHPVQATSFLELACQHLC